MDYAINMTLNFSDGSEHDRDLGQGVPREMLERMADYINRKAEYTSLTSMVITLVVIRDSASKTSNLEVGG